MKKKLLFRIGTLQAGGAERMLVDIINHLDTNLYDITLLLNVNYGVFKKELRGDINFKYLLEEIEFPFLSKHFPIVSKIIRKIKIETFNVFPILIKKLILKDQKFDTTIGFIQDLVDQSFKIEAENKILWVHATISKYPHRIESCEKHIHKYDKIIVISQEVKKDLQKLFPEIKEKIIVCMNPINKKSIVEKSLEFQPIEYKIFKEKIKIISVGRISQEKGFLRLVELKKMLDENQIDCELFIVGMMDNKDYVQKLNNKIKELGVSIHLLDFKENPYPYIKNADIMIHPSLHEGYGLVLAESLILGTPVIASDIKVFREFANDEIFYVANNDDNFAVEALEAIKKILSGDRKGKIENTNIVDINEYVLNLNNIL